MPASQNGWVANDESKVSNQLVPGTQVKLKVRKDAPGLLLLEFASAFDREVEDIDNATGCLDDWAYAERDIRGGKELSNHASGTAIDLNSLKHVLGKKNTFTATQILRIRQLIDLTDKVLRWGGDYDNPKRGGEAGSRVDEMHVELNDGTTLADAERALAKFRAYNAGGSSKETTSKVQGFLNRYYRLNLAVDGILGPKTGAAIRQFQTRSGLPGTGKLDPATLKKMGY